MAGWAGAPGKPERQGKLLRLAKILYCALLTLNAVQKHCVAYDCRAGMSHACKMRLIKPNFILCAEIWKRQTYTKSSKLLRDLPSEN